MKSKLPRGNKGSLFHPNRMVQRKINSNEKQQSAHIERLVHARPRSMHSTHSTVLSHLSLQTPWEADVSIVPSAKRCDLEPHCPHLSVGLGTAPRPPAGGTPGGAGSGSLVTMCSLGKHSTPLSLIPRAGTARLPEPLHATKEHQ